MSARVASGPGGPAAPTPSSDAAAGGGDARLRRLALAVLAPAILLALALAALWPGLFTGHDTIVGNTGDPSLFIWSLAWAPFALSHHLNPLVTDYIHYPSGANLMWNTSILFPALVLTPVTNLFGPIVSYNLLALLGMWLSGWCAFLAVGRLTRHWLAAGLAGVFYEFSPFMVVQITGHAHLFVAVFPPLLVLFAHEILVRQRHRAWLMGGLLGLAAACQLLTGTELLAISALMSIPALVTLAIVFRDRLHDRLPHALRAAAAALGVFAVLAAYPLYILLLGPQRVSGSLQGFGFVARPTSFLIPSRFELFGGPSTVFDSSVYIGVPLVILGVAVAVRMRRHPAVLAAAVTVVCAVGLALGGHLTIHGPPTRIPLPWIIAQHLPVLENVLPVRLMVAGYLALAVILAVFLDRVLEAPLRLRAAGLAVIVVALVPLIPTLPIYSGQFVIPAFFTDGSAARLPSAGSVLITPYGGYGPEVWQAVAGISFKTQLGLVFTPGPGGHVWNAEMDPLGTELTALGKGAAAPAQLSAADRATYLGDMRAHDVTTVIVGPAPGSAQVAQLMTELLGGPGTSSGGVTVWYGVQEGTG
ncbi:MAG: hypothetical protein ABR977_08850 [Candidatus Dormibacteria bacterium]|jgi:hypothetical protein